MFKLRNLTAKAAAFMMLAGCFSPFAGMTLVFAAESVPLYVDTTRGLQFGATSPVPSATYATQQAIPAEQTFLRWDMSTFVDGGYELSYFVDDGRRVTVAFRLQSSVLSVYYDAETWNGTAWVPTNTVPESYSVHTNKDGGGKEHFVPIRSYFQNGYNSADPDYQVLDTDARTGANYPLPGLQNGTRYTTPMFTIKQDQGFSFRYGNEEIHFVWDAVKNELWYATNGIKLGNIYDFSLKSANAYPIPADTTPSVVSVNNGFDLRKAIVTPIANDTLTVANVLNLNTDPDTKPGGEKVGLKLEIPAPKIWNDSSKKYEAVTAAVTPPVPMTVVLGNKDSTRRIQVDIKDVTVAVPSPLPVPPATNANIDISPKTGTKPPQDAGSGRVGDMVVVHLTNLTAGIIYDVTSVSVAGQTNIVSKRSDFEKGRVFTFPEYEIVQEKGEFFAKVQPFVDEPGYFMLKTGFSTGGLEPSVIKSSDGATFSMLPLTVNSQNQGHAFYQLFFSPEKNFTNNDTTGALYSQIVEFTASADELSIGSPSLFEVTGVTLTPVPSDLSGKTGRVAIGLKWDLGSVDVIDAMLEQLAALPTPVDTLTIRYDLNESLTPDNKTPSPFAAISVHIRKAGANDYWVSYTVEDTSCELVYPTEEIPLVAQRDPLLKNGRFFAEITILEDAISKEGVQGSADFVYPNIYFLNARPTAQTNIKTGEEGLALDLSASLYDSMTLSDISRLEVPPPQDLMLSFKEIVSPKDEVSFRVQWEISPSTDAYLKNSYGLPPGNARMFTTLYISQNQNFTDANGKRIAELGYAFNPADPAASVNHRLDATAHYNYIGTETTVSFSGADVADTLEPVSAAYADPREALRAGEIVAITFPYEGDLNLDFVLDMLDKNQKYYACADLFVIQQEDPVLKPDDWIGDLSKLSNIESITTKGVKDVPSGEDKVPPAPRNLDKKDISLSTATIFWDRVAPLDENEKIEYEILRIKDNQIDQKYLDSRDAMADMWSGKAWALPEGEKAAFQSKDKVLYAFDGTNFTTAVNPAQYLYKDEDGEQIIYLTDNMLKPNALYFYYVRTVKWVTINGTLTPVYSVWSRVSLTTSAVQPPKNLKCETGRTDYDVKTEMIISFDAPIPYESLSAMLGKTFDLAVQLKKDGEEWGAEKVMPAGTLIPLATEATEKGYTHFIYKMTGLSPSSGYSVRVRMLDLLNKDASVYSNIATFRTDFDQEEYEDDKGTKDWTDYLDEQLAELSKTVYWTGADNDALFEAIYRPGMTESAVTNNPDAQFKLAEGSGKSRQSVYYIPAAAYDAANKAGKGFTINHGNMSVLIPPGAIDLNTNPAALAMLETLKHKDAADYFVRILINWDRGPVSVEGSDALCSGADIRVELVATEEKIVDWDKKVYDDVLAELKAMSSDEDWLDDVRQMIKDEETNEEISKYTLSLIEEAKEALHEIAHDAVLDTIEDVLPVMMLDKPMAVVIKNLDGATAVSGWRLMADNVWESLEVVDAAGGKAVYTRYPGLYPFTGRKINIPGIENVEKGAAITGIVAKYGLDDYLGKDVISMQSPATRTMVAGCVARMMGAPKSAGPFEWLKTNKGIAISSRNEAGNIENQEALHLLMALYEAKTGTKIATLKIRNYTVTAGMTGLDEKYKQSVRAAFETGVCADRAMQPKGVMSIGELLRILGVLDGKTKL